MTEQHIVRALRERELLREYDRTTEIRDKLVAQLTLLDQVRADLVEQMRVLLALDDTDQPATVADDGLDGLTRPALYELAGEHRVAGRSRMNREQLVEALRQMGVTADGTEG